LNQKEWFYKVGGRPHVAEVAKMIGSQRQIMTPEDKRLEELVAGGAMVADMENNPYAKPTLLMHPEIVERKPPANPMFYYVETGAQDQHDTRAREFDTAKIVHGRDLDLSFEGVRVAYVAPIVEWPDADTDEMNEMLSICRHELTVRPGFKEAFDNFVVNNRPKAGG
jgi:hypothetical protein